MRWQLLQIHSIMLNSHSWNNHHCQQLNIIVISFDLQVRNLGSDCQISSAMSKVEKEKKHGTGNRMLATSTTKRTKCPEFSYPAITQTKTNINGMNNQFCGLIQT